MEPALQTVDAVLADTVQKAPAAAFQRTGSAVASSVQVSYLAVRLAASLDLVVRDVDNLEVDSYEPCRLEEAEILLVS